jgi:hypothetical protein
MQTAYRQHGDLDLALIANAFAGMASDPDRHSEGRRFTARRRINNIGAGDRAAWMDKEVLAANAATIYLKFFKPSIY